LLDRVVGELDEREKSLTSKPMPPAPITATLRPTAFCR